ncbi:LLM class flavin-dependent oxidoreductase [Nocardia sp. NPDC004654]|uniref:LLM class flavin-dependent oxidoreductase n=1 Tax=Nocardia sp. NPDC004654 TaxID=3154776 RepID=UPI0033BF116F
MELSVVVASRPNVSPEQDVATGIAADRLGYRDIWVGEGWIWDAFALATAIGLRTTRAALTVGPIPVSVRDPASIARAAASTAALVGRPVGVALGTSSVRMVEGVHGRSRSRPVSAMAESAAAVRALFAEDQVGLVGDAALVREKLKAYTAAGLDEVVLVPATDGGPGGERTLTAFADWR